MGQDSYLCSNVGILLHITVNIVSVDVVTAVMTDHGHQPYTCVIVREDVLVAILRLVYHLVRLTEQILLVQFRETHEFVD